MAEINVAYAVLSDTVKRATYDSTRDKNQFRDEPPDLEPRRSEAPRPEPSSYKKHRQNSEADAGEEAKSKPETDIQSGYAAAKGFRERAGRGSTSSFSSSKENEPIRHATSHRPGFIRRSWLMLLFAITLMVLTFLIYLLPTLYRDWKIWGQLIFWGVGAKYCYTALFRSNIPESRKKSV